MNLSATTISWILTAAFLVILLIGFLIGLWRGLKKSVFKMIISLVGAVIAFFITPVVTNAVMGIKINYEGTQATISEIIVDNLKNNSDIAMMIDNNPNMEAFIEQLPAALGSTVIFILLTIAIECVLYIIYRIFASIFMKKKSGEKFHRLGGAFVGLGTIFVIVVFAFMPLASLVSTASDMIATNEYTVETADADDGEASEIQKLISENVPEIAINAVQGVNGSLLTKISGVFGLNNAVFDYYANVTVDNQKIYVRQEVANYYEAADFILQVKNNYKNIKFSKLDYDRIEKILEKIENGGLFKTIIPNVVKELVVNYENYSFLQGNSIITEYSDIIDDVRADLQDLSGEALYNYFKNDIDKVYQTVKTLGKAEIIDDILDLEEKTAKSIVKIVGDSSYTFRQSIRNIFDMNLVQNSLGTVSSKVLEKVKESSDSEIISNILNIGVSTKDWTTEQWDTLADNARDIVNRLSYLLNNVEINEISDVTEFLDTTKNYNLTALMTNLGKLIDDVRANELLRTSENEVEEEKRNISIFEPVINDYDLAIPENGWEFEDLYGHTIAVQTYQALMEFFAPPVEKVKANDIYTIISKEDSNEKIKGLADVLSKEGNENILSEILLPLYQFDLTKEKVFDNISTLQNDLVNFSTLENYDDWKTDLGYVSQVLKALSTKVTIDDTQKSYLEILLGDDGFNSLVDKLDNAKVDDIFKPILYAKSTAGVRTTLFSTLASTINNITGGSATITVGNTTFVDGGAEDQAQEICNVIKQFLAVGREANDIEHIEKAKLGRLLNAIKVNAYRQQLSDKTNEGILKDVFDGLYGKITTTTSFASNFNKLLGGKQSYEINFEALLSSVDIIENAIDNSFDFIDKLADIISTDETGETELSEMVNNIIDTIDGISEDESGVIDTLISNIDSLDIDVISEDTQAAIEANEEGIRDAIENNENISDETKQKIFDFLFGSQNSNNDTSNNEG